MSTESANRSAHRGRGVTLAVTLASLALFGVALAVGFGVNVGTLVAFIAATAVGGVDIARGRGKRRRWTFPAKSRCNVGPVLRIHWRATGDEKGK